MITINFGNPQLEPKRISEFLNGDWVVLIDKDGDVLTNVGGTLIVGQVAEMAGDYVQMIAYDRPIPYIRSAHHSRFARNVEVKLNGTLTVDGAEGFPIPPKEESRLRQVIKTEISRLDKYLAVINVKENPFCAGRVHAYKHTRNNLLTILEQQ